MATPNLNITTIAASQNQKEVTANEAFTKLDTATQGELSVNCAAGGTVDVSSGNFLSYFLFTLTGSPGAAFTLRFPDGTRTFAVHNTTGKTATVRLTSSGTTVTLYNGQVAVLKASGVNVIQLAGSPSSGLPVSITAMMPGQPGDGATVFFFKTAIAFTLPASLTGSYGAALTGSAGNVSFSIRKNGVSQGTVNFPTSDTATFTFASDASFGVGDTLAIVAPSPQDANLSDVSITLLGVRN